MELIPNSLEWWENEFENNWTKGIDGREQTAYFMRLIIKHILPLNFYGKVLDFGCALGQGVYELKRHYPALDLTGYDFSKRAIFEARVLYPGIKFTSLHPRLANWGESKFDFVVCSNVLEHFKDPLPVFEEILDLSKDYVIVMTPYDQSASEVHECMITKDTFPVKHNGFEQQKIIIVPSEDQHLCGTTQIIFIYRRCENAENS